MKLLRTLGLLLSSFAAAALLSGCCCTTCGKKDAPAPAAPAAP
jgi:hypothetical protein